MIACKICILRKGLKGSEVAAGKCEYAFKTEEELEQHLLEVHEVHTVGKK
jgi:hypothetical protein